MSRTVAFWLLATSLGVLLFAASAPSPLYSVYQSEWRFSTLTLTIVYAIYALALLVALVFAGSLSDQVGRRPVLLVALSVQVAGMFAFAFAFADGVAWLYVAPPRRRTTTPRPAPALWPRQACPAQATAS